MTSSKETLDNPARLEALNPAKYFIVQAPAGSGKTTLLAKRYVELLCWVENPEEILAITFTKKAANEMRSRVFELLDQQDPSARNALKMDQSKGWRIKENPNRLKIQTIDALANEIAKQSFGGKNYYDYSISEFPSLLYQAAAERVLKRLYNDDPVTIPIANFLEFCSNDFERASRMIVNMLAKRDQWLEVSQMVISEAFDTKNLEQYFNELIQSLNQDAIANLAENLNTKDRAMASLIEPNDDLVSNLPSIVQAITTQTGSFRKRLTVRDHPNFSDKETKAQALKWIEDLYQRGLLTDFLMIRNLPQEFENQDVQTIADVCVCIAMAAAELEEVMAEEKEVDFIGIAMCAHSSLTDAEAPTDLALQLGYQFRHLLIDEFQDTSRNQIKFFNTVMESWDQQGGQSFFAVGDPMQSIYSFRDADVSVFLEIQRKGLNQLPIESITLNSNFRSDPKIVDWINKLFASPKHAHGKQLFSETKQTTSNPVLPSSQDSKVLSFEFESVADEIERTIAHIIEVDNGEDSIGILCRSRNHLTPLLEAMNECSITWQANDFYSLENEPLIRDLLALHDILYSHADKLSWLTILRSPLFGFTLMELEPISQHDDIRNYFQIQTAPDPRLNRLREAYDWAMTNRFEFSPREVIEGMWIRMGGVDAYEQQGLIIALAFFELVDQLAERAYDPEKLRIALSNLYSPPASQNTNIQVMTIHKAKGLEFDHVIVPFLDRHTRNQELPLLRWSLEQKGLMVGVKNDPVYKWLHYQDKQKAENESKRLLYVALTRARRTLFTSYTSDSSLKSSGLAKFLQEISVTKFNTKKENLICTRQIEQQVAPGNILHHLPKKYQWKQPKDFMLPDSPLPQHKKKDTIETSSTFEMTVGTLVHHSLCWLTKNRDQGFDQLIPFIRLWSDNQTHDSKIKGALFEKVTYQVEQTLENEKGKWILKSRENEVSEFGLTGIVDGVIQRVFVDRMFIDDRTRWIIDYKSGAPKETQTKETFHQEQIARHKPQLKTYLTIASNIYPEKIRTALFFTAIATFEEIIL